MILSIDDIAQATAEAFGVTAADIKGPRRPERFVIPRQAAMALSREITGLAYAAIGEAFGGRDHGTVLFAIKANQDRMETNELIRITYENLRESLLAKMREAA